MNDWQEFGQTDEDQDDEQAITLGDLRDGETVTVEVEAEPELFDSDKYGTGIRVPSTFIASDFDFESEDGEPVEREDDVVIVSWSKRFAAALNDCHDRNDGLVGSEIVITKSGKGMDTEYSADAA